MTSAQIRQQFLDFFTQQHAHAFVPSSPVVPQDDPTLLFTNAGMNQFKPIFLGTLKPTAQWGGRVCNSQKCIRAGGKHNDLDDVGRSRRHHTFFEMLGNWSFGDYFKPGAIEMAWELLTKVLQINPRILHVSCYEGDEKAEGGGIPRDNEAADIWKKVANWEQYGLKSVDHIHYFGKDNFWEMGDTGPCGPCTEIYIDRRPESEVHADVLAGRRAPVNGNDPRVMEIWNLVFIQYNRDASGHLTPLPAQHVDTGMGLERLCQVLQNKDDNYATDLFTPLFTVISQISNLKYTGQFPPTNAADPALEAANPQLRIDIAFRVIADHIRCLTFALTDGAVPSNEGRGYVLRRILRRAVRFGRQQLNVHDPFLFKLVPVIVETMGGMFPELKKNPQHVIEVIKEEEISFGKTIDRGIDLFNVDAADAIGKNLADKGLLGSMTGASYTVGDKGERYYQRGETATYHLVSGEEIDFPIDDPRAYTEVIRRFNLSPVFAGEATFRLYDTYGFPPDLTRIMAEERGMTVDLAGYEKLMEEARERSRLGGKEGESAVYDLPPNILDELHQLNIHPTDDAAKFTHKPLRAAVRALWNGQHLELSLNTAGQRLASSPGIAIPGHARDQVAVILDKTNFYAEQGGQIGDAGEIRTDRGADAPVGGPGGGHAVFEVATTRIVGGYILHIGHVKSGTLKVGDAVTATVLGGRDLTMKNHTATHLANWALREVLGEGVQQKGSLVDPEKLRFDFTANKPMTDDELAKVESLVNDLIAQKLPVHAETAPQETALKIHGLRAVFGEKYPPMVRVVSVGAPVVELLQNPANPAWHDHPIEFCGGTHLSNTAEAEAFVITADESVSKGIRRIVALTGPAARTAAKQAAALDALLAQAQSAADTDLPNFIAALQKALAGDAGANVPLRTRRQTQSTIAELQDRLKKWQKAQAHSAFSIQNSEFDPATLLASAPTIAGTVLVVATIPNASADTLRSTWDWLKKKHPQGNIAALLASEFVDKDKDGNALPPKVNLLAAVGDPLIAKLKAGDWVKAVAPVVGGSGGGRPQLAMAGGKDVAKIPAALEAGQAFAQQKLA